MIGRLGLTLGGWTLDEELGQGSFARVFRARHPSRPEPAALKLLLATARSPEVAERFRREVELLQRLEHPGLVRLLDHGEQEGILWCAEELIVGPSLARQLERHGRLEPREAARIAAEVGEALAYLHAQGVVHRDLKPGNVLLDPQGRARLIDLGLALEPLRETRLTTTGALVGTPFHMAPEQLRGDIVGPPADVWALGVLLHALIAGRPPFQATGIPALAEQVEGPPPRPLHVLAEGVPPGVSAACLAAVPRDPARRPGAAELARALRGALEGRRPPGRTGRAALGVALALAAAGGLLTLLSAGEEGLAPAREQPPDPRPDALLLTRRAADLISAQQLSAAAVVLDRAVALDPKCGSALRHRGLLRRLVGDLRTALQDLDQAVALDPRDAEAVHLRALVRWDQRDLPGALADLDRALALAPHDASMRAARGALRLQRDDPAGAVEDCTRVLELDPRSAPAHYNRAQARHGLGELPGALADFDRAIELDPAGAHRALTGRGLVRQAQGDLAGAIDDFDRAVAHTPGYARAWFNRGLARAELADERARADLERALELDPGAHWADRARAALERLPAQR